MMLAWMAYTLTVGALLTLAAFGAEQVAQARRAPARWIWLLAMAASVALPSAMPSLSIELPAVATHAGVARTVALRQLASPALRPAAWAPRQSAAAVSRFDIDRVLKQAWMAASACMLAALGGCALYLSWRQRRWANASLAGAAVLVSDDVGPAVVGLLHHRIVVPAWLVRAPAQQQRLVIAHEQAHLAAADPRLLTLALLALVAMPWNLPLWWQWRRLRLAVEVDCDARVLAAGHDLRGYGAALIDVGARQSGFAGSVAAMAASRSSLEHRIGLMVRLPARWKRRAAPALAALSLCMVAVAARVGPPGPVHHAIMLPAAVLQSYAGYYQLDEHRVIIVAQADDHLSASFNMVRRMKLVPESANGFFMPGNDIQVSFVRPPSGGAATGLVLRQHGVTYPTAARTGAEAVEAADAFAAERFSQQQAVPGGAQILRRNLDLQGELVLSDFSPEFGAVAQRMLPMTRAHLQQLGKVQSIQFTGVNRYGWDMYQVQHEHGSLSWHLWFDGAGKVADVVALNDYQR
jgi:beta-lactamase regulating signal transducer with metallopeptidase domain